MCDISCFVQKLNEVHIFRVLDLFGVSGCVVLHSVVTGTVSFTGTVSVIHCAELLLIDVRRNPQGNFSYDSMRL